MRTQIGYPTTESESDRVAAALSKPVRQKQRPRGQLTTGAVVTPDELDRREKEIKRKLTEKEAE